MADTPQLPFTLADLLKGGVNLNIGGTLPGELLITKGMDLNMKYRETMDPAIAKRWDLLMIQQAEDAQSIWRGIWVALGLLK